MMTLPTRLIVYILGIGALSLPAAAKPSGVPLYSDGRYSWYYPSSANEADNPPYLLVYDAQTGRESRISLNHTDDFADDELTIHGVVENNGRITAIVEEARNSNGWVEGTSVWTIDCPTGQWHLVANGISEAKFRNGGKEVVLTQAICRNPWAISTFEKEYSYHDITVPLDYPRGSYQRDIQNIAAVYNTYVFGYSEDNLSTYFTPNALRQLRADYDYDCDDGNCYGFWALRTGGNDSREDIWRVTSINPERTPGSYLVTYIDGGDFGATRLKMVDGRIDSYKRVAP